MNRPRIGVALFVASVSVWSGRGLLGDENPAPTPSAKPAEKAPASKVTARLNPTPTANPGRAKAKSTLAKSANANDEALEGAEKQRELLAKQKLLRGQQSKLDEKLRNDHEVARDPKLSVRDPKALSTPTPVVTPLVPKP